MEDKVRQITSRHSNFIQKQKEKIADLDEHNQELAEENKHLQEQIDAMAEEKDRMVTTENIQDEEIKRLHETEEGKGDIKSLADSH